MKTLSDPQLGGYVKKALEDKEAKVRSAAQKYAAFAGLSKTELAEKALAEGNLEEKRSAIQLLGSSTDKQAADILGRLFAQLTSGKADPSLSLDILEAAQSNATLKAKAKEYLASRVAR